MNKRRWYLLVGAFALAALIVVGYYVCESIDDGPIRYRNFEKIQEGMTLANVEDLLGCPPGNYTTGRLYMKVVQKDGSNSYQPMIAIGLHSYGITDPGLGAWHGWHGDRGQITVVVDEEGKVSRADYCVGQRLPPDWRLALERKLGLTH
jgi:hypothetical protein